MQMDRQLYMEVTTRKFATLFECCPLLLAIEIHFHDRHVQLRKGAESGIEERNVEPTPDEWKDPSWLREE